MVQKSDTVSVKFKSEVSRELNTALNDPAFKKVVEEQHVAFYALGIDYTHIDKERAASGTKEPYDFRKITSGEDNAVTPATAAKAKSDADRFNGSDTHISDAISNRVETKLHVKRDSPEYDYAVKQFEKHFELVDSTATSINDTKARNTARHEADVYYGQHVEGASAPAKTPQTTAAKGKQGAAQKP